MLKTTKEFDFVYKNSYKFRAQTLDICVFKPNLVAQFCAKFGRIQSDFVGFSVSKKVGIAVERNLIKRRLRAICREFFKIGNLGNLSLDKHSADLANFGHSQTISLVSRPKFAKNYESHTENPSVVLNANYTKNAMSKIDSSLRGSLNEAKTTKQFAEFVSEAKQPSKNNHTNLICIFIAKNGILQMPFGALKESIFATLKRQINFRSDSYKNKRDFSPRQNPKNHNSANLKSTNHANRAHTKALQQ